MNKAFLALALALVASVYTKPVQALDESVARGHLYLFQLDFNDRELAVNENSTHQTWFESQPDHKGYWFLKKAAFNRRLSDRERSAALFLMFKGFPDRSDTLLKQLYKDTFAEQKPEMQNFVYRFHMYLRGTPPPLP